LGVTTNLKLPYPELTDAVDGPSSFDALAQGVEDYFYRRILPAGITRMPVYNWGAGSAYPSGAAAGDTFTHQGLGPSLMRWNGSAWRQAEAAEVPNKTARLALSTGANASLLYSGFAVHQVDTNVIYEWDGTGSWNVRNRQLILSGTGTIAIGAAGTMGSVEIDFPVAFAQPPNVQLTLIGTTGVAYSWQLFADSTTTTLVEVLARWTLQSGGAPVAGTLTFNWTATGTAG
jgi:hypothetical protein